MRYNPDPPYNVLQTDRIPFSDMQRIARFARYWEMIGNSGRFRRTLPLLLDASPYAHFMRFSDWLFRTTAKTHEIALERLFEHVHLYLTRELNVAPAIAADALLADYEASGARGRLSFTPERPSRERRPRASTERAELRQARHLR
jgi:hypothetical protein